MEHSKVQARLARMSGNVLRTVLGQHQEGVQVPLETGTSELNSHFPIFCCHGPGYGLRLVHTLH